MRKHMKNLTFDMLGEKIKTYIEDDNEFNIIKKSYEYASIKHFGQKRLTGEDYIIHPLNVAYILTDIKADYETLSAAILHDVVEDCSVSIDELKEEFGDVIANLVDGVTKIGKLNFTHENENTINNQRKILVGLSDDVRVIIIKLADRLDNLRYVYTEPGELQKEN